MTIRRSMVAVLAVVLAVGGCRAQEATTPQTGKEGTKVDFGVTNEPCPQVIDTSMGCIYLGTISDLTEGPFKVLAVPIADAQKAFWRRVNEQGGIGGYEIDVTTYVKDNKYNPQIHTQVYQEIKPKILALAQTLGSPTTAAILPDLKASNLVAVPASWTSLWAFEDVVVESGTNYCIESMNSVDYAADKLGAKSVMAVHLAGDYGDDAAAGAKVAAEKRGLKFTDVTTATGQDNQAGAIDAIVSGNPDVVILTNGPTDAAVIIGQAAAPRVQGQVPRHQPDLEPRPVEGPGRGRDHVAVPAVVAAAALRRRHSGPRGDAGCARQGAAAQRGVHRGLGAFVPPDGGVEEGSGEQGPHPSRSAGRGEVTDLCGVRGHAPAWRRQLQRQPQRHGVQAKRDQQARRGRTVRDQRGRAVLHRPDREGLQGREALLPVGRPVGTAAFSPVVTGEKCCGLRNELNPYASSPAIDSG